MDQQSPADSAWQTFFKGCFSRRISSSNLLELIPQFEATARPRPLAPERLARALLDLGSNGQKTDPRLPSYLETLLDTKRITVVDLLLAIAQFRDPSDLTSTSLDTANTLYFTVFRLLSQRIANDTIDNVNLLLTLLGQLLPWMSQHPASATVGLLVSASLGSPAAEHAMTTAVTKKFKASFARRLTPLVNNLSSTNIQLASALSYYQKQYDLQGEAFAGNSIDILNGVDLAALSFNDTVMDNESVTTRAGLYIYLNTLLSDRPTFDDINVMNFLSARYKGNLPVLVTELILAAFDILANAMYRAEPQRTITILRSFLVNKLPAFLGNYTAINFAPLSIETCISQALLRIDPTAFPSLSQMFDFSSKSSIVSEARQEFLFSCALHQLIPEGSIENLLGDVPMQSLPASGRYMKADLVSECTTNPAKIEDLIGELENMEGNAGEIAGALFEIITTLCSNNDTMTLKGICICLVRKSATLDSVALFCPPQTLLQPLCNLLDGWEGHEDQVENQPVYEEFGSVLLLVSTIKHRFKLQPSEMNGVDPDSFTSRYFRLASESRKIDQLSEHENDLLGGWVRGLFEAEGINDELMSTCKPAEFYLLIATLFDQSIKACQSRTLTMETLKGGFEYLLEPFLLPSLLAGLTWFANTLWSISSSSTQIDTLLPALHTLLKPPSISTDSAAMHSAVLARVDESLNEGLNHAQLQHKNRVDIQPLLEVLRPHMTHHREKATAFSELETWTRTPPNGLSTAMGNMIQGLISWSFATATTSPPPYTHRLLLSAQTILGATTTLNTLLDIITHQATHHGPNSQEVDTVFDIIVTMLTAPQPTKPPLLTLPSALRTLSSATVTTDLSKTDPARASILVRLHRRVDAVLAATHPTHDLGLEMNMSTAGGQGMMLHDSQGMPATDIDAVLAHTEGQIASGDFLGGVGLGQGGGMEL
ncbi:MAG: hypothetical protein L6R36_001326 [Xanthoria steineri]|nr:MAG: hypothetical protein L6R36_001326 [Xanthoria steineri]